MVLGTSRKTKRVERPMRDVSPSARSVTPVETSPPSLSSEVKQINSSASSVSAASSSGNKANPASPTTPQAKAAAFIPANPLQSRQIRPVPAPTSSLAPSHGPEKQDAPDERVPSSPPWPSTSQLENPQGWGYAVRINSNYLPNVDWGRTFWRPANANKTMQTLGITGADESRGVAQLWAIGTIENAWLEFGLYKSWNIKVTLPNNELKDLQDKLRAHGILGSAWTGAEMEQKLNISSRKQYVDDLLSLIEDTGDREYLEELTQLGRFPFTYNGITDTDPNPGHAVDEFVPGRTVAVQFQVHSLNFRTAKNPDAKFEYSFRLVSVYLVQPTEEPEISTPSRRKRGPDEWMISPPRTKNGPRFVNPLEWPTDSCPSQSTPRARGFEETRVLGKR